MSEVPSDRAGSAKEWLRYAKGDLHVAELILRDEESLPSLAAFHAQQAAEKALKAILILRDVDFPRTHDLVALAGLLPHAERVLSVSDAELEELTTWAVEARYPGELALATREEARTVYSSTRRLRTSGGMRSSLKASQGG